MFTFCFAGFQTWVGQVDVKSSLVYFYVQRDKHFDTLKTPIPFDEEILNIGGAMNLTSGKFTAPRDGIYAFAFTGNVLLYSSSSLYVYMHLNGISFGGALAVDNNVEYESISFQSTLNLKKGDLR